LAGPLTLTSLPAVEFELKQLHEAGVSNVMFIDDTFNVPLRRFKLILKMMIANRFNFNWFSFFRCAESDDECFDLMRESGCKGVFLGIESGDQDILNGMNKHAAIERYKYGIGKLNEYGIMNFASFIIGFPGETRQSVQNTIDFIEETRPTFYRAEVYFHSDNFPIEKEADKYGLRGGGYSWSHRSMDWKTACDMVDLVYRTVRGSVICPLYMFDFWSMPYLFGQGISLERLREFGRISQRLLLMDLEPLADDDEARRAAIYDELLVLTKEISREMQTASGRPPLVPRLAQLASPMPLRA
jgi:p-methyltransferase